MTTCDPYDGNDLDCDGIINYEDALPNNPNRCTNDLDCDGFYISEL